jgi:hypothetical protein
VVTVRQMNLDANGHDLHHRSDALGVLLKDGQVAHVLDAYNRCGVCNEAPVYEVSGVDSLRVKDPCAYPDGIITTVELAVPSGRIVVTDDLRDVFGDYVCTASYNTTLGQHQAIVSTAARGYAQGWVGNSCPGLYRTGEDAYMIASPDYDEDTDVRNPPDSERLATVRTGVWSYAVADYSLWREKGGKDPDPGTTAWHNIDIVDVTPGTYRFTHLTGVRGFDQYADGVTVYARIERIA